MVVELCCAWVLLRLLFNICKHDITGHFKGEVGTSPAILEATKAGIFRQHIIFFPNPDQMVLCAHKQKVVALSNLKTNSCSTSVVSINIPHRHLLWRLGCRRLSYLTSFIFYHCCDISLDLTVTSTEGELNCVPHLMTWLRKKAATVKRCSSREENVVRTQQEVYMQGWVRLLWNVVSY